MKKAIILSAGALLALGLVASGSLSAINKATPVGASIINPTSLGTMFKSNSVLANTYTALGPATYSDVSVPVEGSATKTIKVSRAHYNSTRETIALGDTEDANQSILKRTDTTDSFTNIASASGQSAGNMQAFYTNFSVTGLNDIHLYWGATEAGFIQLQSSSDGGTTWAIIKTDDGEDSTFAAPTSHNTSSDTDWNYNVFTWKSWHVTTLASTPVQIAVVYVSFGNVAANYCHLGGLVINAQQAAKDFAEANTDCAAFKANSDLINNLIAIKTSLTSDDITALGASTVSGTSQTYLDRLNMFLNAAGKSPISTGVYSIGSLDPNTSAGLAIAGISTVALAALATFFGLKISKKKADR